MILPPPPRRMHSSVEQRRVLSTHTRTSSDPQLEGDMRDDEQQHPLASGRWIVIFSPGGRANRLYGDFRLDAHPPTHPTIGYQTVLTVQNGYQTPRYDPPTRKVGTKTDWLSHLGGKSQSWPVHTKGERVSVDSCDFLIIVTGH